MMDRMKMTKLKVMKNPDEPKESAVVFFYHDMKADKHGYAAIPVNTGDNDAIQHLALDRDFRDYLRIQLYLQSKEGTNASD